MKLKSSDCIFLLRWEILMRNKQIDKYDSLKSSRFYKEKIFEEVTTVNQITYFMAPKQAEAPD